MKQCTFIIIVRVYQGWISDTPWWIVSTHSCPAWQIWSPQWSCNLCPSSVSLCRSGLVFLVLLYPVLVPKGPTDVLLAPGVAHCDLPAEAPFSWFYLRHLLIRHIDIQFHMYLPCTLTWQYETIQINVTIWDNDNVTIWDNDNVTIWDNDIQ